MQYDYDAATNPETSSDVLTRYALDACAEGKVTTEVLRRVGGNTATGTWNLEEITRNSDSISVLLEVAGNPASNRQEKEFVVRVLERALEDAKEYAAV